MKYINLLKQHNLKVTPQRLVIVESVYNYGHINIDKLYAKIKEIFTTISLATIYKNIHIMSEKGLIKEVKIPDEKNVYELTKKEHSHIVCTKCHNITDIELNTKELVNQATVLSDFQIDKSAIVFNGICKECVA